MVTYTEWTELDTYATLKFIEDVRDEDFAPLFESKAYELHARKLGFLSGYSHYVLSNKAMVPYFELDYISNGENHFYLDGSEHPLELLMQRGVLRLSAGNIMDYLQFHSDVAFYPYRKVKFITDPGKTPYSGASAMSHHFKTLKYHNSTDIVESEAEGCFYVTMPVLYNGETVKGHIQVMKNGVINILQPLKIPMMDCMRDHAPLHYSHPHENELLHQNLDILRHSPTGNALIERFLERKDRLIIISGVEHQIYVPQPGLAYVIVPQNIEAYSPYQVIDFANASKDLDLQADGTYRGEQSDDVDAFIGSNTAYNLEVTVELCRIMEELENTDFADIVQKFRNDGYEGFYSAYKNGADDDALYQIIIDTIYKKEA
jgi:hypothetical protein